MKERLFSSLLLNEIFCFRGLLFSLTARTLKSLYTGSAGGFLWVYLRPLIVIFAYYFVFDEVLQIRLNSLTAGTPHYSLYLLSGLLPWLVYSEVITEGASCLNREGELLKKSRFPLELIPARIVLTASIKIYPFMLFIWLAGMINANGTTHAIGHLLIWMALQALSSFYIIIILTLMTAALRDIGLLVESVFPLFLFFSPILYPLEQVPDTYQWLLWLNPFTSFATGYHTILLNGKGPEIMAFVIVVLWVLGPLLLAHLLLSRSREQVVDWL